MENGSENASQNLMSGGKKDRGKGKSFLKKTRTKHDTESHLFTIPQPEAGNQRGLDYPKERNGKVDHYLTD